MHDTGRFWPLKMKRGQVAAGMGPLALGLLAMLVAAGMMVMSAMAGAGGGTRGYSPEEGYGEENPGAPTMSHCKVANVVNCATGNLTERQTDLTVRGRGPGLNVTRTYNSQLAVKAEASPFGYGWTGPYSAHLVVDRETGTATVHQGNGSAVVFHLTRDKTYTPEAWAEATLAKEGGVYVYTLPDQTKLTFNNLGQMLSETDRNGNTVTLIYNPEKHLLAVTDGDQRRLVFEYTPEGQVSSIKDPMGHTVRYTYGAGDLASVTLPGEAKPQWRFAYRSHKLTEMGEGRNLHPTTIAYDDSNHVVSQVDPMGHRHKLKYATLGSGTETKIIEPNGSETVEQFNKEGEPTKVTRAAGSEIASTTEYRYDKSLDLIAKTDPNGHTTEYGYDSTNDKTSERDPIGDETKWTYDSKHDIQTITTSNGAATTITRNKNGEPVVIERPVSGKEAQKTTFRYNAKGDLIEETDPLGNSTKYTYDSAGDRESETDPEGDKRTWKYNLDSQEIAEVSPKGNAEGANSSAYTTWSERDERGRLAKVTDPLGHTTEYKYEGNGNKEAVTDGNGHGTKYIYDEDNEQIGVEEPGKTVTKTGYDAEGKIVSHTDGNKNTTAYRRNSLEEITEEVDPLKRVTRRAYDAAGNLETMVDPLGRITAYTHDAENRLTGIDYSDGKTHPVKYEYAGNVVRTTDGTGVTVDTYDGLGRLVEVQNGHGEVVSYKYNIDGQPIEITYPNHKSVTRAYDRDGRLQEVTDWNAKTTKFSYDPDANLTAITFPSESMNEDRYTYDGTDKMSGVKMFRGTEALTSLLYARDGAGQVKLTTAQGLPGEEATEDVYSENNRLAKAGGTEYEYDGAGNPTKIGADTYTYDSADELRAGAGVTYTYNEAGQRVAATPAHGSATNYGYDQAGNLITVERSGRSHEPAIKDSYTYDGNGLRSSQTVDGETSNLTWNTAEELPLLLSDGTNNYIYGADSLPIEQISKAGATLYLHHDQQGSTRLLTNTKGEVETSYTYNSYGKLISTTGAATTPLLYDGQYTNTDTGLTYLRARSYDSTTAQFLTVDPALSTTNEPYAYTGDNPLNRMDPTGNGWRIALAVSLGALAIGAAAAGAVVTAPVWGPALLVTSAVLTVASIGVSIWAMWRR